MRSKNLNTPQQGAFPEARMRSSMSSFSTQSSHGMSCAGGGYPEAPAKWGGLTSGPVSPMQRFVKPVGNIVGKKAIVDYYLVRRVK